VAAQLAVMPLMARYFNNMPLIGTAANIPVGIMASISTMVGITFYFITLLGGWMSSLVAAPLELILHCVTYLLKFFASLPHANLGVSSPGWPQIALYWIFLYIVYEAIIRRRLSRTGIIATLAVFSIVIWSDLVGSRPSWKVEFIEIGRNRAWVYSDEHGKTIASYDCHRVEDKPNIALIPHILDFYDGKLDYLFSASADSPEVLELGEAFSPRLFAADSAVYFLSRLPTDGEGTRGNMANGDFPENIKFVWGESDNRTEEENALPALQIDAVDGILLFAGWSDIRILAGFQADEKVRLLEMPWSVYSQNLCRSLIERLNPELVIFSPDRFTNTMPRSREELTHSERRLYSTSICGGFEIAELGDELEIRTMKKMVDGRE
jgi:hypothetical protein